MNGKFPYLLLCNLKMKNFKRIPIKVIKTGKKNVLENKNSSKHKESSIKEEDTAIN